MVVIPIAPLCLGRCFQGGFGFPEFSFARQQLRVQATQDGSVRILRARLGQVATGFNNVASGHVRHQPAAGTRRQFLGSGDRVLVSGIER